jgi:hypothetical protein
MSLDKYSGHPLDTWSTNVAVSAVLASAYMRHGEPCQGLFGFVQLWLVRQPVRTPSELRFLVCRIPGWRTSSILNSISKAASAASALSALGSFEGSQVCGEVHVRRPLDRLSLLILLPSLPVSPRARILGHLEGTQTVRMLVV